ncbi:unnamed protein product, partial [Ectocarpus sp. 4 AP-2014]
EEAGPFERRNPVTVDGMLKAEGEPSVNELLTFLGDPLSDDRVREDEREKAVTVEHVKLLRCRLEKAIKEAAAVKDVKLLRDRLDETIQAADRKVDTIHETLNDLIELMTKQGIREEQVLPGSNEGVALDGDGMDMSRRDKRP